MALTSTTTVAKDKPVAGYGKRRKRAPGLAARIIRGPKAGLPPTGAVSRSRTRRRGI